MIYLIVKIIVIIDMHMCSQISFEQLALLICILIFTYYAHNVNIKNVNESI